ncbi:CoA transferase [Chloroflexota bacterium]
MFLPRLSRSFSFDHSGAMLTAYAIMLALFHRQRTGEGQELWLNRGYILDKGKLPHFYRWGGGGVPYRWSFGWLTGKDNDLICVKPGINSRMLEQVSLSPVCRTRLLAFSAFAMKALLMRLDENLRDYVSVFS